MRPIELILDGFRSYHDQAVFRWEERRLVGDIYKGVVNAVLGSIGVGNDSQSYVFTISSTTIDPAA